MYFGASTLKLQDNHGFPFIFSKTRETKLQGKETIIISIRVNSHRNQQEWERKDVMGVDCQLLGYDHSSFLVTITHGNQACQKVAT